jgi:hypothetical protein
MEYKTYVPRVEGFHTNLPDDGVMMPSGVVIQRKNGGYQVPPEHWQTFERMGFRNYEDIKKEREQAELAERLSREFDEMRRNFPWSSIQEILQHAKEEDVELAVCDGELRYKGRASALLHKHLMKFENQIVAELKHRAAMPWQSVRQPS